MLTSNSQTIHRIAKYQTINAHCYCFDKISIAGVRAGETDLLKLLLSVVLGHTENFHHYQRSLLFNKTVVLKFVIPGKTTESDALPWNHSEGTARSCLFTSAIDLWGV